MEVITSPIWEPYTIYKLLTGKKKKDRLGVALMNDSKSRFTGKAMLWIRSNLFISRSPQVLGKAFCSAADILHSEKSGGFDYNYRTSPQHAPDRNEIA